jgi:hypothetical protein
MPGYLLLAIIQRSSKGTDPLPKMDRLGILVQKGEEHEHQCFDDDCKRK